MSGRALDGGTKRLKVSCDREKTKEEMILSGWTD